MFNKSKFTKLECLGYYEIDENYYGVSYQKNVEGYVKQIDIIRKANGKHIVQCYQHGVNSDGFNNMVGMTFDEVCAVKKEFRRISRKYKWGKSK